MVLHKTKHLSSFRLSELAGLRVLWSQISQDRFYNEVAHTLPELCSVCSSLSRTETGCTYFQDQSLVALQLETWSSEGKQEIVILINTDGKVQKYVETLKLLLFIN